VAIHIWKHRKKILSLLGATVIFGTFLTKDLERDGLKDLVDSIDAAENAYIIRSHTQDSLEEIHRFEKKFAEFREHPTLSKSGFSGGGSSSFTASLDGIWWTLKYSDELESSTEELFDNVARLANKLPNAEDTRKQLRIIRDKMDDFRRGWNNVSAAARKLPSAANSNQAALEQLDRTINDLTSNAFDLSESVAGIGNNILREAERERVAAERRYAQWNVCFYSLYVFGWVLGCIGVLLERDDIKESLEEI
jgi:hypothetical protein